METEKLETLIEDFRKNMQESRNDYYEQIGNLKLSDSSNSTKNRNFIDTGSIPSFDDVFGAPSLEEIEIHRGKFLSYR